jgi:hypothetical protein
MDILKPRFHWICIPCNLFIDKVRYSNTIWIVGTSLIAVCGRHIIVPFLTSFLFLGVRWDWVHLVRRPLTGLLYQPRTIGDECVAVGGMRIGRGNRGARRKPAPLPLCSPQIPHDLTCARTRAAAEGNRRLTAWAMALPTVLNELC